MTPLPHNPAITVIDLPEGAKDVSIEYHDNHSDKYLHFVSDYFRGLPNYGSTDLPPGTYKLICLGLQATEEEAAQIVEWYGVRYMCYSKQYYTHKTATASLRSLITSNGWKNPVFLRNV